MLEMQTCPDTVSGLEALILGADGACIDLGLGSILGLVAAFVAAVVILKVTGRTLLNLVFARRRKLEIQPFPPTRDDPRNLDPSALEQGPIRSTRPM